MQYLPIVSMGITFKELPGHVSLFLEFGRCEQNCKGCHSPHLRDKTIPLIPMNKLIEHIQNILTRAKGDIDSILFMGGTTNGLTLQELKEVTAHIHLETKLPIGIYSGSDVYQLNDFATFVPFIKWVKIGSYQADKGGLDSPTTNQRLYEFKGNSYQDITYKLQRKR